MILRWSEVFIEAPTKIYIAHLHDQPLYRSISDCAPCSVELVKGLPENLVTLRGSLLVIDDLAATSAKEIKAWHIRKSHHYHTNCITINQSLFDKDPVFRSISLNSHFLIVHKNPRDNSQITYLARQLSPTNIKFLTEAYFDSTKRPYSYLLCDLRQDTNNFYRYRSSVFPNEAFVYVCNTLDDFYEIRNGFESSEE